MPEEDIVRKDIYLEEAAKTWIDIQTQWLTKYPHIYYLVDHEGVLFPFNIHSQLDQLEDTRVYQRVKHMILNNDIIHLLRRIKNQSDAVSLVTASFIDTKSYDFVADLHSSYGLLQERSHKVLQSIDPQMKQLYGLIEPDSLLVFINDSKTSAMPHFADYLTKRHMSVCDTWGVIQMNVPAFSGENGTPYSQKLLPVIKGLREKNPVPIRSLI